MTAIYPNAPSVGLDAIGTYTASSVVEEVYRQGKNGTGQTTRDIKWYIQYPTNAPRVPRPCIIVFSGGGYNETFLHAGTPGTPHLHLSYWTPLVTAGAVVVAIDYRAALDSPEVWNDADQPGETIKRRAIRAMMTIDEPDGIDKWMQVVNRRRDEFIVDPRRVIVVGWSAGGVSAIYQLIHRPTHLLGAIVFTCGFGHTYDPTMPPTSDNSTRDVREVIVETDITISTAPILAHLTGNDGFIDGFGTVIPTTTFNLDLRTRLELFPQNLVHWKPIGDPAVLGHDGPAEFGDVVYDGDTVSTMEGCRRWFNDQMSGLPAKAGSKLTYT